MKTVTKSHVLAKGEVVRETGLSATVAVTEQDMNDVFRLRHDVFTKTFTGLAQNRNGKGVLDIDLYDAYCQHLIVRDNSTGQAIATTRLLGDEEAGMIGHFYSQEEFFLPGLTELPGRVLELGRTCIHEEYRDGAAIFSLWQALARFLTQNNYRFLVGCASISMDDGGVRTEAIMKEIRHRYLDNSRVKAIPKTPVPDISLPENVVARMPALLKTYLRLGAKVAGEPCWDKSFGCADVFILLDTHELCPRYARRFHLEGWCP
ncbi:GNAT family N-acetyltransferase [Sansalvadorimonas sp. 2012CJ34-2]|uniref:L-ornithine N(alpha)-acyltransferase n=1 Tax=Parendozoicomonas callyspongiae TaxID=2942213 RepID=A0ABT0PIR3_9GAMM|nr:GNAT family N-acyltransferase [Sansalvadorimonas sp. 2012CJ34-2]MCL6270373.1 GNAT family N-acetyltransferase [Sansalvadorimonas sp. 2012CJ34-2]